MSDGGRPESVKPADESSLGRLDFLNLPPVINAAGKLTALGASAVYPAAARAGAEAARRYFVMEDLERAAGRFLSEVTGAEAGFVTSCAAAGIALSVAACVTEGDLNEISRVPFVHTRKNKIVVQRGHVINFGADLLQMVRLGGGEPVQIGSVNKVEPYALEGNLTDETAAVLYVVSHHTSSHGMLSLPEVIAAAEARNVPVIVDAAAESDLKKYVKSGADLVVYSGHKAIGGPTSGVVVGREPLISYCRRQNRGIGRTMKVGKESIVGLLAALSIFVEEAEQPRSEESEPADAVRMQQLMAAIGSWPGVTMTVVRDRTRPIHRLQVHVDPDKARLGADEVVRRLEEGNPIIKTRNHQLEHGIIQIDPRTMEPGDDAAIARRLRQIFSGAAD